MEIKSEQLVNYFEVRHETYQALRHALHMTQGVIAGGAAREAFLNKDFGSNDIDIYFPNHNLGELFFEVMYKSNRTSHYQYHDTVPNGYRAKNFRLNDGTKIQIIYDVHPTIKSIFSTFDFTCCQFAIKDDTLYYTPQAIIDTMTKKLVATNNQCIKDYRLIKYVLLKGFDPGILFDRFNEILIKFIELKPTDEEIDYFIKGDYGVFRQVDSSFNFFVNEELFIPRQLENWQIARF